MHPTIHQLQAQLGSIQSMLLQLHPIDYTYPIYEMGNASVGQHVRHTIEIIQGLVNGYVSGEINYGKRKRDLSIETCLDHAHTVCNELIALVERENKPLRLMDTDYELETTIPVGTSYFREVHFTLEHTIHHMALMKTGLKILKKDITDDHFGVAYSTIHHRMTKCAQ
jgi:hypothetical protein